MKPEERDPKIGAILDNILEAQEQARLLTAKLNSLGDSVVHIYDAPDPAAKDAALEAMRKAAKREIAEGLAICDGCKSDENGPCQSCSDRTTEQIAALAQADAAMGAKEGEGYENGE